MRMTNNEYNTLLSNRCTHVVVHMTHSNSGNTVCVFYLPLYLYCVIKIKNMFSYLSFFYSKTLSHNTMFFFNLAIENNSPLFYVLL